MIQRTSLMFALNAKANDFCTANGVDPVFGGKDASGKPYDPKAVHSYIRFDLLGNDTQRNSVKGNETDYMQNGIYQAMIMVGKSSGKNAAVRSAQLADLLQDSFTQNLVLTSDGQDLIIVRSNVDIESSDEMHEGLIVSIYFDCIG